MKRILLRPLLMLTMLYANAQTARAEIIIDDFVDDLRIDVPEQNLEWVLTDDVGDLRSFRRVRIAGLRPIPVGFLDINSTRPSALTAEFPTLTNIPPDPILGVNIGYTFTSIAFDGVDLTESGKNNAVILEFGRLTANVPLHQLRVSAAQSTMVGAINTSSTYSSTFIPIPQSSGPFNLVFPFDSFRLRRGAPIPDFDFSFIRELSVLVDIALINPNLPEELAFRMVLERVRVGHAVPEPSTWQLSAIGMSLIAMKLSTKFVGIGQRTDIMNRMPILESR